jgi:predicted metal-dependent hydrolase
MINKGFLNTHTAITQKLMQTARTLEAEWRQFLGEAWVWGQRMMSQVLGVFRLLYFTMLWPGLAWCVF